MDIYFKDEVLNKEREEVFIYEKNISCEITHFKSVNIITAPLQNQLGKIIVITNTTYISYYRWVWTHSKEFRCHMDSCWGWLREDCPGSCTACWEHQRDLPFWRPSWGLFIVPGVVRWYRRPICASYSGKKIYVFLFLLIFIFVGYFSLVNMSLLIK